MSNNFTYTIKSTRFDEHYQPANHTRATTNFANLARGKNRQENLCNALKMINNRFNAAAHWDNPEGDRYSLNLEIISVEVDVEGNGKGKYFPSFEILKTYINDHKTNKRIEGIVGNNFSSYVRDYDFSIVLLDHNKGKKGFSVPQNFGDLHGKLFQDFM
ncbi:MAG: putative oxygenase MesX, partial [Pseudomonadota bacterium]